MRTSQFWLSAPDLAVGFEGRTNLVKQTQDFVIGIPGATLLADNPTLFVPLPTSSVFRLGIESQTIYNVGIQGPTDGNIASQVNYADLVSQIVTSAARLNAQRIGGKAGGELVGGIAGLIGGVGKVAGEVANPKEAESALRNVKWTPPASVKKLIDEQADQRQLMGLEETKAGNKDQQSQNNAEQPKEEKPKNPVGNLIGDLFGG